MTEFRADIGSSSKGTFVRVVHEPTGKERTNLAADGCTLQELVSRLQTEIERELEKEHNVAQAHVASRANSSSR